MKIICQGDKKGFTLIELLVVLAILGVLATLIVVSFASARQKARDVKRLADVKQIQTALELFYNDQGYYPIWPGALNLGSVGISECLNEDGFQAIACADPFMGLVPRGPLPGEFYTYTSEFDPEEYVIEFTLEGDTQGFTAGIVEATPRGMQNQ